MGSIERKDARDRIAQVLLAGADLESIFLNLDPYAVDYGTNLSRRAESATAQLWRRLEAAFPGLEGPLLLANAWAVASQRAEWMAALHCAAMSTAEPELQREAARLLKASCGLFDEPVSAAIAAAHSSGLQVPPNLRDSRHLKPGLRLRFALAHHWATGADAEGLLEVAATHPNASTYLRCRELVRALRAGHKLRPRVTPLSEAAFLTLREGLQTLALASQELRSTLLPESLARNPDLPSLIRESRVAQRQCAATLRRLIAALSERDFGEAAQLLGRLGDDEVTRHLASGAFGELDRNGASSALAPSARRRQSHGASQDAWEPLRASVAKRLERLVDGFRVPPWWALSTEQIADGLARGSIAPSAIDSNSLVRIQQSWTEEEHLRLARAGRFDVLPATSAHWGELSLKELFAAALMNPAGDEVVGKRIAALPDARPVLALLSESNGTAIRELAAKSLRDTQSGRAGGSWSSWVVKCVGTPEWAANARRAGAGADLVGAALTFHQSGGTPIDPDGFRSEIVNLLVKQRLRGPGADDEILRYMAVDPQAADLLAQRLRPPTLRKLLESPKISVRLLDRLALAVSDDLRGDVWRNRLLRASTATKLRAILLEQAHCAGSIPWNPEWLDIAGSETVKAEALVLACRRDRKRLRLIAKTVGDGRFTDALRASAARLPAAARRDKGFLELLAVLGASEIPFLSAVMSMADRRAGAGHKLDRAYQRYRLPKRSGGSRVISVPHHHLKRVQRAILDRLIQPLGAHESAFGFVPGRSIGENAALHVGQAIVANVDVSNCFPSVKWPLVLGVLRRDLGDRLGPGAISLLVDICTADGGLPIGAPTSPALLNRVLLRSDETLHSAATKLNCRYSRYADDLTFSGDHGAVKLLGIAKRTLSQIGLELDPKKTNIYRPGRRQIVTGLVVNERVSVPRRIRRRIRAAVHAVEQGRAPVWHDKPEDVTSLRGRLSFVNAINPTQATPLIARLKSASTSERSDDGA